MKTHRPTQNRDVYVGFVDAHPHVQREADARVIAVYVSRAAARRAYTDVRKARLVFDAAPAAGEEPGAPR